MRIKKLDVDVILIGDEIDMFEDLLEYYNGELLPDDTFIGESDLVRHLLREAIRKTYYNKNLDKK